MLTPWVPEDHHRGQDPAQPADEVRVVVWPQKPYDLPSEMGHVFLPADVGNFDAAARARLVLDLAHRGVLQLAGYRGWDTSLFEDCYGEVLAHDFVFEWAGAWKSSPGRRHRARALFTLTPRDGSGRISGTLTGVTGTSTCTTKYA